MNGEYMGRVSDYYTVTRGIIYTTEYLTLKSADVTVALDEAGELKGVSGTKKLEAASAGAAAAFNTTGMTLDGNALSDVTNAYVFTIAMNGDKFVIQNAETGTYLANRGSYLYSYKTLTTSYCLWSLAMTDGAVDATNAASKTRPHLTFHAAKNYFMVNSSTADIFFWKLGGSSAVTTYTTVID
jgi:hypothetical protein